MQLLCTGHTSSAQWPRVASGFHIGERMYGTFPSSQKVLVYGPGFNNP